MSGCALACRIRNQYTCSGRVDHYCLSENDRELVASRAAAAVDGITLSPISTHICLYHYNQYLYRWKAEGCIDPQCCLLLDTQVAYKALVECPQRVLSVLKSIHKLPIDLPIGSLIHYQCRDTFDERYKCHDGYQPAKKRQRTRYCSSQQKRDDKVCMYS